MTTKALLLVDLQNDFMPFGSLPVADGDAVVAVANEMAHHFDVVVATQDWHPADHGSFASNHPECSVGDMAVVGGVEQVLWPDHCVQSTPGASLHSALDVAAITHVVRKGTDPSIDSYSAFFDNGHRKDTGLTAVLKGMGVSALWIMGLATDYCVLYTALDARAAGFSVSVIEDGVRAVELAPGDGALALERMRDAGCSVVRSSEIA
ncbi:MAG: bifunctional nicotinamidase/pyrazinamidase [Coriobacteriia bacterium]|nr:bifunctional nicotinamidase/pyrazinamidase [Coriobacteriia bacterium]